MCWSPCSGGAEAALAALALSLFGLVYIIGHIRALDRRPLLVSPDGVRVRLGLLLDQSLAPEEIVDVRCVTNCGDMQREGFLKASLLAYPNALIELARPICVGGALGRGRQISTIAVRPDDADAFVKAIRARTHCPH